MLNWSKIELIYYAEYVKLTHYKFIDYYMTLTEEEEAEEMAAVLLKLMVYNKKVIVYKLFSREIVDILDFKDIDKISDLHSWVPSNFVEVEDYLAFVYSLEMDEDTGEVRIKK